MKNRLSLAISLICLLVFLFMNGWLILRAIEAIRETVSFQSYPPPYHATVVEIDRRSTGRSATYTHVVEVVRPGRGTFRFRSSRQSAINQFSVGESVELVCRDPGLKTEKFEIDNALHLWIKDVLIALLFPTVIAVAFLWPSHLRSGALTFSPFRALRRKHP